MLSPTRQGAVVGVAAVDAAGECAGDLVGDPAGELPGEPPWFVPAGDVAEFPSRRRHGQRERSASGRVWATILAAHRRLHISVETHNATNQNSQRPNASQVGRIASVNSVARRPRSWA